MMIVKILKIINLNKTIQINSKPQMNKILTKIKKKIKNRINQSSKRNLLKGGISSTKTE